MATGSERSMVSLREQHREEPCVMWPVRGLHVSLPEHLHASEDTDFLLIRCSLCHWSVWFSGCGVSLVELARTVEEHRACPARAVAAPKFRDAGDDIYGRAPRPIRPRNRPSSRPFFRGAPPVHHASRHKPIYARVRDHASTRPAESAFLALVILGGLVFVAFRMRSIRTRRPWRAVGTSTRAPSRTLRPFKRGRARAAS
jgi:hypothetical protein